MDPFYDKGKHVYGERFVGRDKELERLQDYCAGRSYSIVGMPRIGKTSLAYNSIIENKEKVAWRGKKGCVLFFEVNKCNSKEIFFKCLIEESYNELLAIIDDDKREKLIEEYKKQEKKNFEQSSVKDFFKFLENSGISLVIIFDEFDHVRSLEFKSSEFGALRCILHSDSVHGIVVSRRSLYVLEKWCDDSAAGSDFHQSFETIYISGFDDDSLEKYWERLTPYFKEKGIDIDEEYKNNVKKYVGNHPYLLDIYNSKKLGGDEDVDEDIRVDLREHFDYIIRVLNDMELFDNAQQAILGPVYNIDDEKLRLLCKYGFLKRVPIAEKERLLGEEKLGLYDKDRGESYIAFSEYFTRYIRSKYINEVSFWPDWRETFKHFRELVEDFFKCNWGENWEDNNDFPALFELKKSKEKDEKSHITPSPIIQYLDESKLYEIFDVFWETFKIVFEPWIKEDFFYRYEYLVKIRNHYGHYNDNSLSAQNKKKAELYLKEVDDKLKKWDSNKELKILNDKGGEGICELNKSYKIIKTNCGQLSINPKYVDINKLNPGDEIVYKYVYKVKDKNNQKEYLYAYDIKKKIKK